MLTLKQKDLNIWDKAAKLLLSLHFDNFLWFQRRLEASVASPGFFGHELYRPGPVEVGIFFNESENSAKFIEIQQEHSPPVVCFFGSVSI